MDRYCTKWIAAACLVATTGTASAESGLPEYTYGQPRATSTSTAYPNGEFAAHLSAARGGDGGCGGGSQACDWGWGCGGSPFRTGPGRCDDWRVGPRWTSQASGVFLFRDDIDLIALAGGATSGGVAIDPTAADTLSGNLEHGGGVRLSLASHWPQCNGYEMQIGYMGVFGWDAGVYDPEVPYAGPLPEPNDVETQKNLEFRSELHSVEVNGQPIGDYALKPYGGVRFLLLNERVGDGLDESSQPPLVPPNAGEGIAGDPPQDVTDIFRNMAVDNHLIGFQGGLRMDFLTLGDRFHVEGFINGGVYCNYIIRESSYRETRSYTQLDDISTALVDESAATSTTTRSGYKADRTRMAFVGEALLGGAYQVNNCTKARMGYQVLYLTGVELGDEAFIGADPTSSDLLTHGWYFGVERRR